MDKRHLGIIGLGVMGKNLGLNAHSKGFSVAGFDLDMEKSQKVREETGARFRPPVRGRNSWTRWKLPAASG